MKYAPRKEIGTTDTNPERVANMIISASRRTDIPAWYSRWFVNRLQAGSVCVRNPVNKNQISRIPLNRDDVDCIVFWTKNPIPMIPKLELIDHMGYPYYFQFTITPYNRSIETSLVDKQKVLESFCILSEKLGKEKVVWRYDPIIVNEKLTVDYHMDAFDKMSKMLCKYTNECIISFVDPYKKTMANTQDSFILPITTEQMEEIAKGFSEIAKGRKIKIKTCAEKIDLDEYGIEHGSCIDGKLIEKITGLGIIPGIKKDFQRQGCECIECIDIGQYDTCRNGCKYCYGTSDHEKAKEKFSMHDPGSEIITGKLSCGERISERKVRRVLDRQIKL